MATNKQMATDRLTDLLGMDRIVVDNEQEGTVPAVVFSTAAERVGLNHRSRVDSARGIIKQAGHPYRDSYDSAKTPSRGGGNVTVAGLNAMADALEELLPPR